MQEFEERHEDAGHSEHPQHEGHAEHGGKPDDTIYVGKKPPMSYVLAVVTQFNQGHNAVKLKARGLAISRAVDVTQIVKHRFMPGMRITNFDVTTEELQSEDGRMSRVSSVTLTLEK